MVMPITRGKIEGPQRVVIYGPEGIGKSTLAAQFPNPVFCDTEGSTEHMDVARTPYPTSWAMLLKIVNSLTKDQQGFQTFVIDTADWAERLCVTSLCAKKDWDSIEAPGYGKGFTILAEEFGVLLDALNELRHKMHVVITAHANTSKFELPYEIGRYDRYEMKLTKHVRPLVKEWADDILFCTYETFLIKPDDKDKTQNKKAQGGRRIIHTNHHPCWDAKNRHELEDTIPLDYAQIARCYPPPSVSAPAPAPSPASASAPATAPEPAKAAQPAVTKNTTTDIPETSGMYLRRLFQLMEHDGIQASEVQDAIAKRGYFPANTPLENLPEDFVMGMLVAKWAQVSAFIKQQQAAA